MLYKIDPLRYPGFIAIADTHTCGKVYPLSIAEGIQRGDIFASSMEDFANVLFWAYCGFAYLSDEVDECFLEDIYGLMSDGGKSDSKRFLLMTKDEYIQKYFKLRDNVIVEKRYLFEYSKSRGIVDPLLPAGYELKEINNELLNEISGKITPSLFWKDVNDFLAKGKGYCVTCDNDIVSWAFSAAICSKKIDIGIETNPKYKRQGVGSFVAQKMIQYTIEQGKEPVWACHYKNAASERMAEKLGFVKVSECYIIKCEH